MKIGRNQFEPVMRKKYFRPEELVEITSKSKTEIKRIAYIAKALYRVERTDLVDYCKLYDFIGCNKAFYERPEGTYITVAEASAELGIPEEDVLQVFARSNAVYELGQHKLINLEEANKIVKQHLLEIEPIAVHEWRDNRPRGSMFVREINTSKGY